MNFLEAVKEMKKGKKVRRLGWGITLESYKNRMGEDNVTMVGHAPCDYIPFHIKDYNATDWEVVEERKTLSNKIICTVGGKGSCGSKLLEYPEILEVFYVKKAIEEYRERLRNSHSINCNNLEEKGIAKEIFGEVLIK